MVPDTPLLLLSITIICAGMAIIAYQDFSKREVSDLVLCFPAVGLVILAFYNYRLASIGTLMLIVLLAIGYILYRYGMIAQGDVMTIPLISTMIYAMPYIAISMAAVTLAHMVYLGLVQGWKFKKSVSVEQARRENCWIPESIDGVKLNGPPESAYETLAKWENPQSIVEESYGLPLAGYVALGSIIGVIIWLLRL